MMIDIDILRHPQRAKTRAGKYLCSRFHAALLVLRLRVYYRFNLLSFASSVAHRPLHYAGALESIPFAHAASAALHTALQVSRGAL